MIEQLCNGGRTVAVIAIVTLVLAWAAFVAWVELTHRRGRR